MPRQYFCIIDDFPTAPFPTITTCIKTGIKSLQSMMFCEILIQMLLENWLLCVRPISVGSKHLNQAIYIFGRIKHPRLTIAKQSFFFGGGFQGPIWKMS